ncbi:hypothetical protein Sste5346_002944 [Sporothrix stenoceras]|uniref:Ubiquitin-like domain-containing protein n=1 Tax=Sporothrix stenoceras TaxID=5173 RepID=A0ABR3ZGV9_9PEZI
MGCCFSRPEGPNSPYPGGAPSGSARAINNTPAAAGLGPSTAAAFLARNVAAAGAGARSGGDSTDAGGFSSSSSTPPTVGSQRLRATAAGASGTSSSSTQHHPPAQELSKHINKPIKRRRWTSRNRVWTRSAIDRERTDFFDTRVTGRSEIWQTLRTALEILWEADLVDAARGDTKATAGTDAQATATSTSTAAAATPASPASPTSPTSPTTSSAISAEAAEARATAQTILDAADITLPTGDMAQGAYDAFGNYYALPSWIVSDPTNLATDPDHNNSDLDETKGAALDDLGSEANLSDESDFDEEGDEAGDDDDEDTCGDEARHRLTASSRNPHRRRRREEKGKAVVAAANQLHVRARLSATSRDVIVLLRRDETVLSLAHRISEQAKLPHTTRIRIAYLGKILKDSASLEAQGWKEGHVVNALVFGAT